MTMKELTEAINKILWKDKTPSREWEDIKNAIENEALTSDELQELRTLFKRAETEFPNGFDSFDVVGVNPKVCIMTLDQRINRQNQPNFFTRFGSRFETERTEQEENIVDENTEARATAIIDEDCGDYYEQQAYEAEQKEAEKEQEYLQEITEQQAQIIQTPPPKK